MRSLRRQHKRTARASSSMLAAFILCSAATSWAQSATTTFDGSYIGMPVAEKQNRSPPCAKPQTAVLDVIDGAARMRSSLDRRKGQVQPDGSLTMNGELVIASQHIPGLVEGHFTADRFEGVSSFPNVHCVYRWSLLKKP
jgi:hypothetical protein